LCLVNFSRSVCSLLQWGWMRFGLDVGNACLTDPAGEQIEDTTVSPGSCCSHLFKKSMFCVSVGSNGFIHYYLRNVSGVQMYLPWEFNQLLVNTNQGLRSCSLVYSVHHCLLVLGCTWLLVVCVFLANQCAGVSCFSLGSDLSISNCDSAAFWPNIEFVRI
jgi:hypothetical protein